MQLFENVHRRQGRALTIASPLQNMGLVMKGQIFAKAVGSDYSYMPNEIFRNTEPPLQPCLPDSLRIWLKRNN